MRSAVTAGLLVQFLILPTLSAANESRSVRFEHLSRDEGLSQSFVYSIVQDDEGYMWIGTQDGLNRYDGFEFTIFDHDPDDPTSISDETIRTMIKSRTGTIWAGTDAGGLSRYEATTETFTNFLHDPADPTSIADNRVRVLYEDTSGVLWVGTDGSGLDRFDYETETFTHYANDPARADSLSNNVIWGILQDSDGVLWVATDAGLNRFDSDRNSFTQFRHDPDDESSLSDDALRVLFEDKNNVMWVGTASGGLNRFDRGTGTFEHFVHDPDDKTTISANRVTALFQDDAGVLWVGTVDGLNAWNPTSNSFERYTNNPSDRFSLIHNNVISIYQDRGGMLWVGTYNGLSRWNQTTRAMLHYRNDSNNAQSLSENTVMSFAENKDGDIWVGTYGGGLNLLDRSTETFRHFRHAPDDETSVSSDRVMSLAVDHEGVLWAGTRAEGLNRYNADTETFTRFIHDPDDPTSLSANGVTYILEDRNDDLWIATFGGGLNAFDRDTGQFRRFKHDPGDPSSLSNDRIMFMLEDSAGYIWIGTYGGGLNRLDLATETFTHYGGEPDRPDGLSGDEIYMIQEDARGDLWIGVKGAGLNRWRHADRELGNVSVERFTLRDGLPNTTIYSGAWDKAGHLWLSTGRGLSMLNIESLEFSNYDTSHGLQGDEYNTSSGFRAADGQLFFGGVNGFNAFYPALLGDTRPPPQVTITSFLSLNEPVDAGAARTSGERITLDHTQNVIGFEYAALDYAAPRKNRYMYKLEGLDDEWVDAATNRQVTYTNLPSGDYTFRVRAANNDGVWSEQDASLDIRIAPAPWATWWAYLVYATVLAVVVIAAFRAHARRAGQAAKLRFAEEFAVVQARLNEAQRIASVGNWDWNIETNELWWSDETYRMFQMDPGTFGATFDAFLERVHADDRASVEQAVEHALNNQERYAIDHRIALPDGTTRIVHERAEITFNGKGQASRMAGTVHDITERKAAEDEIRHRAEYQSLLAELSSKLMMARTSNIDEPMKHGLEMIGTKCELDAISIWWFSDDKKTTQSCYRWVREENKNRQTQVKHSEVPWIAKQLSAGSSVAIDDVKSMPDEAAKEQKIFLRRGLESILIVPLRDNERLLGAAVFALLRESRTWSPESIAEYKLIAENLAGAIVRSRAIANSERLQEKLQVENLYLQDEIRLVHGFAEIVGEDRGLKKCLMSVEKVAPTDVPVLVLGETGTGKELIARAVHSLSPRRDRALVSVNCPTLPANIIESELFGHEKGAFTGAHSQRRGRFELADKSTLFLDEIGELPIELQSKLLRVLQTGDFVRLGGTETLHADVRVIAATNRNLEKAVANGEFRADLFYRINNFPIRLPALRHRKGDIPLLAEHFARKGAERLGKKIEAISAKMIRELTEYPWPGNVRELESVIERALISSADRSVLDLPDSLPPITADPDSKAVLSSKLHVDLSTAERQHIVGVLEETRWKISGDDGAAAVLGIPASTLRSKMKRLGISRQSN